MNENINESHNDLLIQTEALIKELYRLTSVYEATSDPLVSTIKEQKVELITRQLIAITTLINQWPENPFTNELRSLAHSLQLMCVHEFMGAHPATIIEYEDYNENDSLACPICQWLGTAKESGNIEHYAELMDVSCPNCDKMLLVINFPMSR